LNLFLQGLIGAAAVTVVAGVVAIVKLMFTVVSKLSKMESTMRTFGASIEAIYRTVPWLIKSSRHVNVALRGIGANGSTERSDQCLDEADKTLDRRLAERAGEVA